MTRRPDQSALKSCRRAAEHKLDLMRRTSVVTGGTCEVDTAFGRMATKALVAVCVKRGVPERHNRAAYFLHGLRVGKHRLIEELTRHELQLREEPCTSTK